MNPTHAGLAKPAPRPRLRLGLHIPVAGGLAKAARRARSLGCECIQIFARNPRGWRSRIYPEDEVAEFRSMLAKASISPLVIHSCYLVNLASADEDLRGRSVHSVADDMARAALLGGQFVATHFGHYGLGTTGSSLPPRLPLRTLASSIRSILADAPAGVQLLLENSAGRRGELGGEWDDFARLFDLLKGDERVGLCFDTCHAQAAGHRVDAARWIRRTLRELDAAVGISRLRLIHLNDSHGPAGSHIDRHQHIGRGTIGDAGFRAFLHRREFRVPQASACALPDRCVARQAGAAATPAASLGAILETPIDKPGDDRRNLKEAKMLRHDSRDLRVGGVQAPR